MDLKVLGCHGGETPKHRTSSFLIDDVIAVDAGAITSQLDLPEQRRIQSVLISHAHMDHVRDLATLADNRCQQGGPSLEIIATPACVADLRRHFFNDILWPDFTTIETPAGPTIRYREVAPETTIEVHNLQVTPVPVNHTVDSAAFIIRGPNGTLAYSGDTGPTDRLWEVLNATPDLRALIMEVSFPDDQADLARVSGHHTPSTLGAELGKLSDHGELPILLFHIKPVFQAKVEKELARLRGRNLTVLQLSDQLVI